MLGFGETVAKVFTYRLVDLSWSFQIHVKIQGMWWCVFVLVVPAQGRQS